MAAERPAAKGTQRSPDLHSVSRIEFDNIEGVVRANAETLRVNSDKLDRLQTRVDALTREIAELTQTIRGLTSKTGHP